MPVRPAVQDPPLPEGEVTRLLQQLKQGDRAAAERLVPLIYDELRRLASRQLQGERRDHTLQTTALVHEAYLKLTQGAAGDFNDRGHFFKVASQVMRQILVDSARSRLAKKRGGGAVKVEFSEGLSSSNDGLMKILVINDALAKLEKLDARQARIVEMRFFVGLETEEVAEILGISPRTVIRDWKAAQAWLYAELGRPK